MTWREKIQKESPERKIANPDTERRRMYYGRPDWRALSTIYKTEHPLCECCKQEGKLSATTDCHHLIKWDDQIEPAKTMLLLDKDNLSALCRDCHHKWHKNRKELTGKQIEWFQKRRLEVKDKWEQQLIFLNVSD